MSEIEKMYENVGVEYEERYNNCTLNKEGQCELKCSCDICKYSEEIYIYPLFTAEKQIELIKWLIIKYKTILIEHKLNLFYINIRDIYTGKVHIEFDETIAGLINNIWQDLTEEEKQQVKGILE